MAKNDFPPYQKWVFKKWYYWVIIIIYSILTEFKSYANFYIPEILGSLTASFLIVTFTFFFIYLIVKYKSKKLKHI